MNATRSIRPYRAVVSVALWRSVLLRVKDQVVHGQLTIIAAGVAFYALLAALPALAGLVALFGLVLDPDRVARHLSLLSGVLPPQAHTLFVAQLREITQTSRAALSLGAAGSLLLTLWSSSAAIRALLKALNVAYGSAEQRGFLTRVGLALLLTLGSAVVAVVAIAAVIVLPAVGSVMGDEASWSDTLKIVRWPVVAAAFFVVASAVYRFGPSRDKADGKPFVWGALAATGLWLAGSAVFSSYASHFGSYNRTYGSMGAVVIVLLWFLLSSYAVLLGAEINAEFERQTGAGRNARPDLTA